MSYIFVKYIIKEINTIKEQFKTEDTMEKGSTEIVKEYLSKENSQKIFYKKELYTIKTVYNNQKNT